MIQSLNSGDFITVNLFGKEKTIEVFSAGDNKFDENGNYNDDQILREGSLSYVAGGKKGVHAKIKERIDATTVVRAASWLKKF